MGFFVDIGTFTGTFIVVALLRKRLARLILKIPLPLPVLYFATALPLIVFEEDINCFGVWCGRLVNLVTVPVLILEVLVIYLLVRRFKWRTRTVVLAYALFGILWELSVGGLVGGAASLSGSLFAFFILWVGLSYAFNVLLPLTLLEERAG